MSSVQTVELLLRQALFGVWSEILLLVPGSWELELNELQVENDAFLALQEGTEALLVELFECKFGFHV